MKAFLLFESHQLFVTVAGATVEIHMDLYQLEKRADVLGSEYRFSWIAFDADDPMRRVLFDSHPPKGPHFHLDNEKEGQSFPWVSIGDAVAIVSREGERAFR